MLGAGKVLDSTASDLGQVMLPSGTRGLYCWPGPVRSAPAGGVAERVREGSAWPLTVGQRVPPTPPLTPAGHAVPSGRERVAHPLWASLPCSYRTFGNTHSLLALPTLGECHGGF